LSLKPARVAVIVGIALLAMLWGTRFSALRADEARQVDYAKKQLSTIARLLAEHSALGFEAAERLARLVATDFGRNGSLPVPETLLRFNVGGDHIVQMAIAGPDGRVVYSNLGHGNVSIVDREHFQVHAKKLTEGTFVSVPLLGRVSKRWTVQVTRRVETATGEFAGVVVVSVDPFYYTQIFKGVDLGADGSISTVGLDGVVRARTVGGMESRTGAKADRSAVVQAMQTADAGTLLARSALDGKNRFYAFERISGFDLAVVVGKAVSNALQPHRLQRAKYLLLGALLSSAIVFGLAVLVVSIRQQEQLLAQLREERQRANSINELKAKFVAMISHEIHTPLTGVLGFSELLAHAAMEPELKDYATALHASAIKLRDIVGEITEMQSAGEGQMPLTLGTVDISELAQSLGRKHAAAAQAKDLRLLIDASPDLGSITTDRRLLAKALGNVLENAIRYTDSGEVRLQAAWVGPALRIDISDTGDGIGDDLRSVIFDRFMPNAHPSAPEGGGLGIGLFHARMLMRAIGGTLELEASTSAGSTFRFVLPAESRSIGHAV
jgi:signal transduction histidine kinase